MKLYNKQQIASAVMLSVKAMDMVFYKHCIPRYKVGKVHLVDQETFSRLVDLRQEFGSRWMSLSEFGRKYDPSKDLLPLPEGEEIELTDDGNEPQEAGDIELDEEAAVEEEAIEEVQEEETALSLSQRIINRAATLKEEGKTDSALELLTIIAEHYSFDQ